MATSDPFAELGFTPKAVTPGGTPSIPTATPTQPAPAQSDPFASLGFTPTAPAAPAKPFKYDIPETRAEKLARYKAEGEASTKASDEANSFGGMAKNFGKAFVGIIAAPEIGLGNTIASEINTRHGGNLDKALATQAQIEKTKYDTIVAIRNKTKKGLDTTADKKFYNTVVDQSEEIKKQIDEMTKGSQKKTSQVVGELGGVALDTLSAGTYGNATKGMKAGQLATKTSVTRALGTAVSPELGKVTEVATKKATGLFTKPGLVKVAKGAGIGYASDVTMGLSGNRGDDRMGGKAFIPGMGTAIGAAIPAAIEGEQSIKNKFSAEGKAAKLASDNEKIITKRQKELHDIENNYSKTRKANEYSTDAGADTRKRVASTDVLVNSVDADGKIITKRPGGAIDQYKAMTVDGKENVVRKNLEREGSKANINEVEAAIMKSVNESGLEGADLTAAQSRAQKEVEGLRLRADKEGNIPLVKIHDAKVNNYKNINYQTPPEVSTGRKAIARALKETVENKSSTNVKEVNGEIGKYLKDVEYLERLDGLRVKGGKLGKYFAQISGNIVGGAAGHAIGGIPGAAVGTVIGGELGSRMKGSFLKRTLGGKTGLIPPKSAILEKAAKDANSPRLMLPAPKPGSPRQSIPSGKPINVPPGGFKGDQATIDAAYSKSLGNRNAQYIKTKTPIITAGIVKKVPQVEEISKSLINEAKNHSTPEEFIKNVTKKDWGDLVTAPSDLRFGKIAPENIVNESVKLPFDVDAYVARDGDLFTVIEKKTGQVIGKGSRLTRGDQSGIKQAIADATAALTKEGAEKVRQGIEGARKAPSDGFYRYWNRIPDEKLKAIWKKYGKK